MSHLNEEQLNAYLDNALSEAEFASVAAHLARCDMCRAELASLRVLFDALDVLQPEAIPIDLVTPVMAGIAAEQRRATWRWRFGRLVSVLQGIAAVLFLVLGWSALSERYEMVARRFPGETLVLAWQKMLAEGNLFWTAATDQWRTRFTEIGAHILSLPTAVGQSIGRWPQIPGLGLKTLQAVVLVLVAVLMWLVGNSLLIRAAIAPSGTDRSFS